MYSIKFEMIEDKKVTPFLHCIKIERHVYKFKEPKIFVKNLKVFLLFSFGGFYLFEKHIRYYWMSHKRRV